MMLCRLEGAAADLKATTLQQEKQVRGPGRDQDDGGGGRKIWESCLEESSQEKSAKGLEGV